MSDESQKPRKTADIRERLGRASQLPPSPNDGVVPPPSSVGGIAPPPGFVDGRRSNKRDPFVQTTGGASEPQKEVRIVVDDAAVATAKEGSDRRARRMMLIAGGAAGLFGLLLGLLASNVVHDRRGYNRAVRDGKALYDRVLKASDQVAQAKQLLDKASAAATPDPGQLPSVDFAVVEQLRSLPTPFSSQDFAGMQFLKFTPETVNALFAYNRTVGDLWERFDSLASKTLPDARRQELAEASKDLDAVTSSPTGCVPTRGGNTVQCGMVYVDLKQANDNGKVKVRASRGSKAVEKQLYAGQPLGGNPSQFVILTNPEQSSGVLNSQRNAFSEYRKNLRELTKLMTKTQQLQGQLEKGLGDIATLEEVGTL